LESTKGEYLKEQSINIH